MESGAPTPEVESNDTAGTANPLPPSGWVSGTRDPAVATEQDWYSMTLNAGDTVFLSLDLDPEDDITTWNGRLGMALFGDANNQILVVDDGGTVDTSDSEAFVMTVKTAGTYYAFVDSATAATGGPTATYNLSVTIIPKVNIGVNCTTYTSTNVPQVIGPGAGLVSSTITVPATMGRIASTKVSITADHALMADLDVNLRSPANNNNGLFNDIGSTATGGQTLMDLTLDQYSAGVPFAFTVVRPMILKPELNYRLDWFDGENPSGVWTLDIRDDLTNTSGGNLTAWSLEICEQPSVAGTVIYSEDFEANNGGYTHSGAADEWEYGTPATLATTTTNPVADIIGCNSGTNCWKTDLDNTYENSSNQELVSPPILLPAGAGSLSLAWAQRYQFESATFDHAFVEIREVGGMGLIKRVWEWKGATMTVAPGSPVTNIGESAGWGTYNADISDFGTGGRTVQIVFHLDTDTSINFAGMAIDDVSIRGVSLNTPPTINAVAVSRQEGTSGSAVIANVNDAEDAENNLVVSVVGPATVNGVTISGISVDAAGVVTATVAAACNASAASFTLQVVDSGSLSATATLNVTVPFETTPPVITPKPNIVVSLPPNSMATSMPVSYGVISASDNCSAPTISVSPASGSIFNVGTTTVTITATDARGNQSTST
ncbi:MAG: proprotein convertase P-domain-containing protein, partial [Acidobacteriota bacterium]